LKEEAMAFWTRKSTVPTAQQDQRLKEECIPAIKLRMLKPSVNNMSVRVFLRAAKLDFTGDNVWGKTSSDEYSAKIRPI
jgi:glutathione S-transferase